MYLGDEQGYLKIWDLTYLVKSLGVKKAGNYPASKMSFNPKRKEQVDQSMIAESFRR